MLLGIGLVSTAPAQVGDPSTPRVHAIVNARIVTAPGQVIPRGTIVIRDGLIEAVGASVRPPADARIWDAESLTVYAGLIDPYVVPAAPKKDVDEAGAAAPRGRGMRASQPEAEKGLRHENRKIRPEQSAASLLPLDGDWLEARRAAGFTAGNILSDSGILRGSSVLAGFGNETAREAVIRPDVAQVAVFEAGGWNSDAYPGSLMGAIALLRQTFSDAAWYQAVHADYLAAPARRERPETNESLEALQPVISKKAPVLFGTDDNLNMLRAARLAHEFGISALLLGSGHEYQRLDAIKALGLPILLPVDFPDPPKLKEKANERAVDTADLRHWALAPANPAVVDKDGMTYAFTADGLKDVKDFRAKVREAIGRGLPEDRALYACTVAPARLLGVSDRLGTVEPGKIASLVMTKGDLFAEKTTIRDVWVDGRHYDATARTDKKPEEIAGGGKSAAAQTAAQASAPAAQASTPAAAQASTPASAQAATPAAARTAVAADSPAGTATTAGDKSKEEKKLSGAEASKAAVADVAPPGLMGDSEAWRMTIPAQPAAVLVRNATIWTSGPKGRIENADLLVRAGKVAAIGKSLSAPGGAVVIDATGKHVTAGLIDCHSHTAISGDVNEGTNNVTAEVRIGDVVNSETINIYRELAGGLTAVNLLHGSANAIGGQNQVIKMRWGALPEDLKLAGAPPGIKFALGENPKQSNWGIQNPTRYPQTRMGVEQLIRERFMAARDYKQSWIDFAAGKGPRPRRDYQLDAIQEILDGKRLIHSHSYRQDEILMLMRLAEAFGIRVATFQHVLEGYKVADEMAAHGAGGSTFSDWWAYKFEVYDAIPYNGSIMRDRGVVVSFNSDSSELARRMNYEAAKAIKYGETPAEEALKFVTLNPAIQLRVQDRIGSLEPGKDADFVIWSGDPLSSLCICEQTWVDGRKYFDRSEDLKARPIFEKEREALIAWANKVGDSGGSGGGWSARQHPGYLDEDGSDNACHDDGTDRHAAITEREEAGR